jgi:redox-sensitive bicupin YhaK (pirin superfamily)
MKKNRAVKSLLYAHMMDMGGMPVRQAFPTMAVEQIDPFLLLHHGVMHLPEGANPDKSGVGPHPHRGFSPVTFVFKGGIHHRDSRGNDSTVYAGGTQWMNAGMGVIHSERPPKDLPELGAEAEIIQLWINTPAANKMDQPVYYPLSREETPVLKTNDEKVYAGVVSGEMEGVKGPVPAQSDVLALRLEMKAGGYYYFPLNEKHNAFFYALRGNTSIDDYGLVEEMNLVLFQNDGQGVGIQALEDMYGILMTGAPINEPLATYGPFVMNTESQIMQAIRDYNMGKMGVLIED